MAELLGKKKKLVFNNLQYLERDKNHNSEVESYKLRRMSTILYKPLYNLQKSNNKYQKPYYLT